MKKKGLAASLLIIVYLLLVGAVGFSFLSADFLTEVKAAATKTVILDNGSFPKSSKSVSVVLNEGECVKLSGFTSLESADFSGSENIEEIIEWAQANPQVDVTYSVVLPDGSVVSSKSETADFRGAAAGSFQSYIALLKYLPAVRTVELGSSENGESLSPEDFAALTRDYPELTFSYVVTIGTQSVDLAASDIDLSGLAAEDAVQGVPWLRCMKNLESIELGDESSCALTWDDIAKIADACPGAKLNYSFTLYDHPLTLDAETVDINHTPVTDNAEALVAALRCMKSCKKLDMDYCGVEDARMEEIRDMFPNIEVIWRIWFGTCYSVRTDTERILASRPSVGGMLDNSVGEKLKYCTKMKYLDLGHNDTLTDISFVKYMPDLEVFIIAINQNITDISPLKNCTKLEYLEINSTPVADISCLEGLTGLHHLNIACTQVRDISPLYGCTELERLWIGRYTEVPAEQVAKMQEIAPNCVINTTTDDPHGEEWRWDYYDDSMFIYHYVPRYELLRTQLGYTYSEYSYYWKDPLCGDPCPPQYVGTSPDGIIEKPQNES